MNKISFLSLVLFIFFLSACHKQDHKDVHIKFIETTDVHGYIFPFDFIKNKNLYYSIANIATYVEQERQKSGQWTILMDNGDILQGQPTVYYYNFIDTSEQHICPQTMNYLNYDVGTVGNHDIEAGHYVYDKVNKEFNFPWLAANAWDIKNDKPYFQPYTILKNNGIKLAILGLITPGIPNWLPPNIYKGIEFRDMEESARYWMKIIKEKEDPDVVIGLFHSGHNWSYNNAKDTLRNENATMLVAKRVPGFDVVFCGHDHDRFIQKIINTAGDSVLIIDPKAHAQYIGTATINLKWNKKQHDYSKTITGEILETKNYPVDSTFINKFQFNISKIKKYVEEPVAKLLKPLDGKKAFFGDNALIDLIHDVQLNLSGAEISFAAPLRMNIELDTGLIHISDMFELYKYENLLYTMKLSGKEINDYLEYSYGLWFDQMRSPEDHLLLFKNNSSRLQNSYYNFDSAEGINYTVDVSKPVGERIKINKLSTGKNFNYNKFYKVAINSYRGNGGGGHLTKGAKIPKNSLRSRIINSTDKDLRYYMINYLKKIKIISPTINKNWKLIPENWVEPAKKRDYKLLFP